ncbi:MAG: cytochrome c biogenesis protein CcsA [Deltaproteobacteria bacterium]|jgi:heme exporter protein C|nr:cytochrome c biogenesis protein CcsA [Deltaproteobacteria bacterium]MBW2382066.1 cytochrome c biogenesis protein CcsA [Deltaproteobacteria bacterium]MBW2697361.1 cytochrome c biogenesis protein CcsA [Deltaproteobacteria bacterium]
MTADIRTSEPLTPATADLPVLERWTGRARRPLGIALLGLCALYAWTVVSAPLDSVQGVIQKILYVHPPLAYGAYLGFIITAIAGVLYLRNGREEYDRLALSSAEVGVIFCTLMLITGPIWGKGTWGRWWSWDPRLTVTLLLWFVYLAYLLLRSFSGGGARTARFASIYGVVGAVLIPLNYYIIEIFGGRGMHPENLERSSLGDGMGLPFVIGNLTLALAFIYLLIGRWEVEGLRAASARRTAAGGGGS